MKLSDAIKRYVSMKQMMGSSYRWGTALLHALLRHMGDISLDAVAKEQVSDFLEKSGTSDGAWLFRYRNLKAFFEYWIGRNELTTSPLPPARLPSGARPVAPYIYSASELRKLLDTASLRRRTSSREFSSLTFCMLLLFLYGTGARLNETLALTQQDIDLRKGTITFHRPPPATGRTIPIGPHLCKSLREYADSFSCHDDRKAFFTRRDGRQVRAIDLAVSFQRLRRKAGIVRPGSGRQPQIRDLRRTFAVHTMRKWLREGHDLRNMLPLLGAYLGHVSLNSTEAYLAAMPERFIMQLSRLGHLPNGAD